VLLLGYEPPGDNTVLKHIFKPRQPRKPSTTWLPFLCNHLDVSWAIDFFAVPTLTFDTLFVFSVLEHGRRKVPIVLSTRRQPCPGWPGRFVSPPPPRNGPDD